MGEPSASELGPRSRELVERGDIDALTVYVNELVGDQHWDELTSLREKCRLALERGKQLWAVAGYIEYRLCLQAPGPWAAMMLESGTGRFALGPLPEVAASAHRWSELSSHLHSTPQAAMAAHERVVRGDDLTADEVASALPAVLDLPLRLEAWEPAYSLAEYHAHRVEVPPPRLPALQRASGSQAVNAAARRQASVNATSVDGHTSRQAETDEVSAALEDLVSAWTSESNGRAEAVSVLGDATDAVSALGAPLIDIVQLVPGEALAAMAWAAADGGAHGRRRGAAPGRFGAWWVLAALGDLDQEWPPPSDALGAVLEDMRWYAWGSGEPITGWALRLAVEATAGPRRGRAWAISATDAS
jgi:hypothetical protein